jgi:hypothetical protein
MDASRYGGPNPEESVKVMIYFHGMGRPKVECIKDPANPPYQDDLSNSTV